MKYIVDKIMESVRDGETILEGLKDINWDQEQDTPYVENEIDCRQIGESSIVDGQYKI